MMEGHKLCEHLAEMVKRYPKMASQFTYPGTQHDQLYEAKYEHPADQATCSLCDVSRLATRKPRSSKDPVIHYGLIASGDRAMNHGPSRDQLAKELDVLCFETEAAGLMDSFPCLVIRGICDYADSHDSKRWQPYAAATAAAYARELLCIVPGDRVMELSHVTGM
jgi:nucleoside phosphorylase